MPTDATPPSAVALETTVEERDALRQWAEMRMEYSNDRVLKVLRDFDQLLATAAKAGDVRQGEIEAWLRAFKGDGPFNTTSCHALADALASGAWRGGAK